MKNLSVDKLKKISKEISLLTLDISFKAKVGHVGSALSIADILAALYFYKIDLNKKNFNLLKRDRFILSKGHAAASLYAVLYKKGILSKEEMESFGQNNGLCEHPEIITPGIEMSSGSLGHGLAFGIGVALGQKKMKLKNQTYVLISDGESNEGSIWEAALLAPKLDLANLTVIIDCNDWQCMGKTSKIVNFEPLVEKWKSFGWAVHEIDGHNIKDIVGSLDKTTKNQPKVIIARTITGRSIKLIQDQLIAHYKVFGEEEYQVARKELNSL